MSESQKSINGRRSFFGKVAGIFGALALPSSAAKALLPTAPLAFKITERRLNIAQAERFLQLAINKSVISQSVAIRPFA